MTFPPPPQNLVFEYYYKTTQTITFAKPKRVWMTWLRKACFLFLPLVVVFANAELLQVDRKSRVNPAVHSKRWLQQSARTTSASGSFSLPAPPEYSLRTCEELTNIPKPLASKYGSAAVCGASRVTSGSGNALGSDCANPSTYARAKVVCATAGMRLCTVPKFWFYRMHSLTRGFINIYCHPRTLQHI